MFLKFSHEYQIDITIDDNTFNKTITTAPDPLYVSFSGVRRSNFYELIQDLSEEKIMNTIHRNSLKAEEIVERYDNRWWDKGEKEKQKYEELPRYVQEYVLIKTVYELFKFNVYGIDQQIDSASLADFEYETGDMDRIEPVIDNLREMLDELLDLLKGYEKRGDAKPKSFVKGEKGDPYPLRPRTVRSHKSFKKRNREKHKNIFIRRNPYF